MTTYVSKMSQFGMNLSGHEVAIVYIKVASIITSILFITCSLKRFYHNVGFRKMKRIF